MILWRPISEFSPEMDDCDQWLGWDAQHQRAVIMAWENGQWLVDDVAEYTVILPSAFAKIQEPQ